VSCLFVAHGELQGISLINRSMIVTSSTVGCHAMWLNEPELVSIPVSGVLEVQVDVVITSCSCFAPTPSMAAMIVNRFKMRSNVSTYSLGGMGCSSSLICVDLAKNHLRVRPAFPFWSDTGASTPMFTSLDKRRLCNACLSGTQIWLVH
jgi:hypothetical protein